MKILEIAGLFGTIWFLCTEGLGYWNIGTNTGLIVSVLIFLAAKYHCQIREWCSRHKSRFYKVICSILYLVIAAVISLAEITTGLILSVHSNGQKENSTVIILGSGVNDDGRPSDVMRERLDTALEYLNDNPHSAIIVSGGLDDQGGYTEAESMKDYLIEHGIKSDRIYLENQSHSTRENIEYSETVLQNNHLSASVLIVTSDFHLYRAGYLARHYHLDYELLGSPTPWYVLPSYWIREMYGILHEWIAD